MKHQHCKLGRISGLVIALAMCRPAALPAAGQEESWELTPCRIHAILAIDAPGELAEQFSESLTAYLEERVETTIGSAWSLQTELATGATRQRILADIGSQPGDSLADLSSSGDKLLLLSVRAAASGFELTGREYDRYVERWGQPIRRLCRQQSSLQGQLFDLVWQVVAPLVRLELDPQDENRVVLRPRGASLPRKSNDAQFVKPGDAFLPILRRITREGKIVEDGIQTLPWTYIQVVQADGEQCVGRIHAGTRRPFGVRRRGRVEQVAIALRADPQDVSVRLHSRTAPEKPLVDYEVHAQNVGEESLALVGQSDRNGEIVVSPGSTPLQLLTVKHGGAVLARLPVVSVAEPKLEVPLPDDDVRLQAELRLAALREEIIDVVARRNILIARTKQEIDKNHLDQAQGLLNTLDQLPGRPQFNQLLSREARLHRSEDPHVQKNIDLMISATQDVLGRYLDSEPISAAHDALRAARKGSSMAGEKKGR